MRIEPCVALFRGVNVGGNNKLPMKDLAEMFMGAGCERAQTFIQSGNVIFAASKRVTAALPVTVCNAIEKRFGFRTQIVLRTFTELRDVFENNPFVPLGAPQDSLYVLFLADAAKEVDVSGLDPQRSPPDEFVVRGKEIFLLIPRGAAKTRLTNAYFDAKLSTVSTARNWRTVTRLHDLMRGVANPG